MKYNVSQNKLEYIEAENYDEAVLMLDIAKSNVDAARPVYLGDDEAEFASINEYYDEMIDQINRFVIVQEEVYA